MARKPATPRGGRGETKPPRRAPRRPSKHGGGRGAPAWVEVVPVADPYRGPHKGSDPEAGRKYADHVRAAVERIRARERRVAAFICEIFPSVGGQLIPPPGYYRHAYEAVRSAGGVCIADEVQTGLGRIGTHRWGFETQGVVPDIVVLGKPIGNGHPIGAVITTPAIAAIWLTQADKPA